MRTIAIFLALGLSLSGCELVKKLQNRRVMAGVVLKTPDVSETGITLQGTTVAYLFLGERQDDGTNFSQNPPTGLNGASVEVSWALEDMTSSATLAPVASAAGQYQTTSQGFYVDSAKYTFRAVLGDDTYTGSVTAPAEGAIQEFVVVDPPVKTQEFDTFVSFTITRASTASDTLAFYTVMDSGGTVTCINGPTQDNPERLLDIVFNSEPYKASYFDLYKTSTDPEKSCFSTAGAYAIELTTLKQGGVSDNLFLGSAVFAGTASVGVLVLE